MCLYMCVYGDRRSMLKYMPVERPPGEEKGGGGMYRGVAALSQKHRRPRMRARRVASHHERKGM